MKYYRVPVNPIICPQCMAFSMPSKVFEEARTATTTVPVALYDSKGEHLSDETKITIKKYRCSNGHAFERKYKGDLELDQVRH